jgi:hypothetical protein
MIFRESTLWKSEEARRSERTNKECKISLETQKPANVISVERKLSETQILLCLKQNEDMITVSNEMKFLKVI